MCKLCDTITTYSPIHNKEEMMELSQIASCEIEKGVLSLTSDYGWDTDYHEEQYTCCECGKRFVLWIDSIYISAGGEWRALPA